MRGCVRLLDVYERPDCYIFVLEKPTRVMDLFDYISKETRLQEQVRRVNIKMSIHLHHSAARWREASSSK